MRLFAKSVYCLLRFERLKSLHLGLKKHLNIYFVDYLPSAEFILLRKAVGYSKPFLAHGTSIFRSRIALFLYVDDGLPGTVMHDGFSKVKTLLIIAVFNIDDLHEMLERNITNVFICCFWSHQDIYQHRERIHGEAEIGRSLSGFTLSFLVIFALT